VVTGSAPEAGWLSGCDARRPGAVRSLPDDALVYVIDFPGTTTSPGLDQIRALAPRRAWRIRQVRTAGRYPTATIAVSFPPPPLPVIM
jgi:hypothetical protein